jgi:thiol peroxidase
MAKIQVENVIMSTHGEIPSVGSKAPGFRLTDEELRCVELSDFKNKIVIISTFLSVDLAYFADSVGLIMNRAKHQEFAARFVNKKEVSFLNVSMDLPFSLKRTLLDVQRNNNIQKPDNFALLSDFRTRNFGADYGLTIMDGPLAGLLARAMFVLDKSHTVAYAELVEDLSIQPNFQEIKRVVKNL